MKGIFSVLYISITSVAMAQSVPGANPSKLSHAEQNIADARKSIIAQPANCQGYNLLAAALVRRGHETSDSGFYAQAEAALKKSLELAPKNFETEKIHVSILLGIHEFPAALEAAQALNKKVPDDVMVYGLLADTDIELGNYTDAETQTQWMLNLRPGNLPALTRAARLRELFGDAEGAFDLMELALQSTSPVDAEERASLLTQMGHLKLAYGSADAAEKLLQQAVSLSPNYPAALGDLAKICIAQKQFAEAIPLLEQRYRAVPRAENLYDLAEALDLAGRHNDAKRAFADFETKSLNEGSAKDNSNRQLVFYYADVAQMPAKALEVAKKEYQWRHDVFTLDAYAWALHVNGQETEARKQIETALAVGIRDASMLRHAGEIAVKMGDTLAAESYLKQSADLKAIGSEGAQIRRAGLSSAGKR